MIVVEVLLRIVHIALIIYLIVLWARIILDLAQALARQWRPRGPVLVLAEIVYVLTDPPIRGLRRVIPPLRFGPVAIDFSVVIIMLAVVVLMSIVGAFLAAV